MIKLISILLILALFLYVGFGFLLYKNQRSFFYHPTPAIAHKFSVESFVNQSLNIKYTTLHEEQDNAIIYLGGNAEIVDNNIDAFQKLFPHHAIYLFKYRSYSGSEGQPSEAAIYSDVLAFYDIIKNKHREISIIGRSLGTGVATYLASQRPTQKLVLITPFDSLQNVAQSNYPLYPMSIMVEDKYDSASRVSKIKAKTLIITAEFDQVIPAKHSDRLMALFPSAQLQVALIKDAGHSSVSGTAAYYQILQHFFAMNP